MDIEKNPPPESVEIESFLEKVTFQLPVGYIDFLRETNGAEITFSNNYLMLWPLTELIDLNADYGVDEFAPGFFIIGSNGGDEAYAIEKETGKIFEFPFIGMSNEVAVFVSDDFKTFLEQLGQ